METAFQSQELHKAVQMKPAVGKAYMMKTAFQKQELHKALQMKSPVDRAYIQELSKKINLSVAKIDVSTEYGLFLKVGTHF